MTELSDYRRMVEQPYRVKMEAKLASARQEKAAAVDKALGLALELDRLRALLTTAAEALEALCERFDTFAGEPFDNPPDSIWATTRITLAAIRKEIG